MNIPKIVGILVGLMTLCYTALLFYKESNNTRIVVLETKQIGIIEDVKEIKSDVKYIITRIDKK